MDAWAYPTAIFLSIVFVCFLFKKPLESFIYRAEKITTGGIEAGRVAPQLADAPADSKDVVKNLASAKDKLDIEASYLQLNIPEILKQEALLKIPLDNEVESPEDKVRYLLRFLSASIVINEFQQIYGVVFGSQLSLLEMANTLTNGFEIDLAKTFYEDAQKLYPSLYSKITFDQWLQFLISHELLDTNENGLLSITEKGKFFYLWMINAGLPRYKLN